MRLVLFIIVVGLCDSGQRLENKVENYRSTRRISKQERAAAEKMIRNYFLDKRAMEKMENDGFIQKAIEKTGFDEETLKIAKHRFRIIEIDALIAKTSFNGGERLAFVKVFFGGRLSTVNIASNADKYGVHAAASTLDHWRKDFLDEFYEAWAKENGKNSAI